MREAFHQEVERLVAQVSGEVAGTRMATTTEIQRPVEDVNSSVRIDRRDPHLLLTNLAHYSLPKRATVTDLAAARDELHDAKPDGLHVGPPTYVEHRKAWEQYALDTRERPKAGHMSREWTAVAESELEVVREMARCLGLIGEGRAPT